MDILKRMGNKTLKLVLMLVFVIVFSVFSLVVGNISISTFMIITLLGFIFIVLNIQARQQEVLLDANSFVDKAEDAIRERQLKSAIRFYDEALFLNPKLVKAQLGKGKCYKGLTEFSKAVEELEKVQNMETSPGEEAEMHFIIGACRMEEGNRKEAQQEFEKVMALDNNHMDVLPYMADLKQFDGKNEEAAKLYVRYLEKCPSSRRKFILDRLEKVDPVKAREFKSEDITVKSSAERVIKSEKTTEPYPYEEDAASVEDENREALPPVDGGYDEESFRLPGYIKKEEAAIPADDISKKTPEVKPVRSDFAEEAPTPETNAPVPLIMPKASPVVSVSPVKTMSVEDVMGDASFVEDEPVEIKAEKPAPAVMPKASPVVSVSPVKTMSVEDVMGDASFVEDSPVEEKAEKPAPAVVPKASPVVSVSPVKTLSVEDVMGDASFVEDSPVDTVKASEKKVKVVVKKAEIPRAEIPADLNKVLDDIKAFAKFAGTVEVDPMLRWSAFSYINRFVSNVRHVFPEAPAFAVRAAKHKLEQLNGFKSDYAGVSDLSRYFQDVFISINNIGVVDTFNVFRSSQPSLTDLSWFINNMDVKGVINLCKEQNIWSGYTLENEEDLCRDMLVDYFHMPMENWDDPSLTRQGVDEIIDRIDFHAKPLLIHSSNGTDRVGIVAAAYRMKYCGWSYEEALDEAQKYGFDPEDHKNHLDLLREYSKV